MNYYPTLNREAILDLLPRQATRRNAAVILDLIEEKFAEGYAELIISHEPNIEFYEARGLSYWSWHKTVAQLVKVGVLILTEKHAKGVRYQKHMVNFKFVVFPKREAAAPTEVNKPKSKGLSKLSIELQERILSHSGPEEWQAIVEAVYAAGHKRTTFKRLLEQAILRDREDNANRIPDAMIFNLMKRGVI